MCFSFVSLILGSTPELIKSSQVAIISPPMQPWIGALNRSGALNAAKLLCLNDTITN